MIFLVAIFIVVPVAAYVYDDARARGLPPFLMMLLIVLTFPLGALLWLLLRPPKTRAGFDLENFRAQ